MTIICALSDAVTGDVWLGCNDRSTIGDTPAPGHESKWEKFGDWAIGISGDEPILVHLLQRARAKFPAATTDVLEVFEFVLHLADDADFGQRKDGDAAKSFGVWGMFVHKSGHIWDFDSRLSLSPVAPGALWARGSGADFALGADYIAKTTGQSAEARVRNAVAAALALDIGCPGDAIVERFVPLPIEKDVTDAPKDEVRDGN